MTTIPRFEQEVVDAEANKYWFGHHDKVSTTPLAGVDHRGIWITSRYRKADELEEMIKAVDQMEASQCWVIKEIFCDSKACSCYDIQMRPPWREALALIIGESFEKGLSGHNGIWVRPAGTYGCEGVEIPC